MEKHEKKGISKMKKGLCVLLFLLICMSIFPVAALAEDIPSGWDKTIDISPAVEDAGAEQIISDVGTEDAAMPDEPMSAADENSAAPETVTAMWVNPLYEDLYEAGLLVIDIPDIESRPESDAEAIQESAYTSLEEAGAYLREQVKARNESIAVTVTFSGGYSQSAVNEMWEHAFAHTGKPDEGDYLYYQYGGWGMSGSGYGNTYTLTFSVTYYTTAEQEAAVDEAIETAMDELSLAGKSAYAKILAIHDYILDQNTYDYYHLNYPNYMLQYTAYAALFNHTSVCQGYAVLTYRMMLEAGIDCRVITGDDHAWNIVQIGDYYYFIDTTWDDGDNGEKYYTYFLKHAFDDHTIDTTEFPDSFFEAYPIASADYVPTEADIKTYTPGDINGDGSVNNKDLVRLLQYIKGKSTDVVDDALDVNGDSKTNNKDLVLLLQYIKGMDVVIY